MLRRRQPAIQISDAEPTSSNTTSNDDAAAEVLEDAAMRIAALASKLASGATNP